MVKLLGNIENDDSYGHAFQLPDGTVVKVMTKFTGTGLASETDLYDADADATATHDSNQFYQPLLPEWQAKYEVATDFVPFSDEFGLTCSELHGSLYGMVSKRPTGTYRFARVATLDDEHYFIIPAGDPNYEKAMEAMEAMVLN